VRGKRGRDWMPSLVGLQASQLAAGTWRRRGGRQSGPLQPKMGMLVRRVVVPREALWLARVWVRVEEEAEVEREVGRPRAGLGLGGGVLRGGVE